MSLEFSLSTLSILELRLVRLGLAVFTLLLVPGVLFVSNSLIVFLTMFALDACPFVKCSLTDSETWEVYGALEFVCSLVAP